MILLRSVAKKRGSPYPLLKHICGPLVIALQASGTRPDIEILCRQSGENLDDCDRTSLETAHQPIDVIASTCPHRGPLSQQRPETGRIIRRLQCLGPSFDPAKTMPDSIATAVFIFSAVLILIALLGGKFKIFGSEISEPVSNPLIRFGPQDFF